MNEILTNNGKVNNCVEINCKERKKERKNPTKSKILRERNTNKEKIDRTRKNE